MEKTQGWFIPAAENEPMLLMTYGAFQHHLRSGISSMSVILPDDYPDARDLDLTLYHSEDSMTKPKEAPINIRASNLHDLHIFGDALLVLKGASGESKDLTARQWVSLLTDYDFAPVIKERLEARKYLESRDKCCIQ